MAQRIRNGFRAPRNVALILLATSAWPQAADVTQHIALTHITVIDLTSGRAKSDYTVVVTGQRITEMGETAKIGVPAGSQVVDATGKFLIPGLWDMHVHWSDKDYLPLFIANGVTGVRLMWGQPAHQEWRRAIDAGQLLGPHLVIASPIIDGPKPIWDGSISVTNETQARQAVAKVKREGADFVKVYQGLLRDTYFAIADESRKQGLAFEGHVPQSVSAEEASRAGQKTFEHLVGVLPACSTRSDELLKAAQADLTQGIASKPKFWGAHVKQLRQAMLDTYSPDKAAALFALFKSQDTWQCPTLTLLRMFGYGDDPAFLDDPRRKYVPKVLLAFWDPAAVDGGRSPEDFAFSRKEFQRDLELVGAMQKSGVGILAGTDTSNPFCFPGFSLHDELGLLVQAGLSPMQALQTATLNPARFLGREQDFGTVERGKLADLLLLDANPLDDIANTKKIFAVMVGGRFLPRASLDRMLSGVEARASQELTLTTSTLIWLTKNVDEDSFYHLYLPAALALLAAGYVYLALALVAIAVKTKTGRAVWGWIPILNIILMFDIAKKPRWWIFPLLIPVVNIFVAVLLWMRIAEQRQKPRWWGVLAVVPVINLIVPGYLAWSA
jgi:hypothetical protein